MRGRRFCERDWTRTQQGLEPGIRLTDIVYLRCKHEVLHEGLIETATLRELHYLSGNMLAVVIERHSDGERSTVVVIRYCDTFCDDRARTPGIPAPLTPFQLHLAQNLFFGAVRVLPLFVRFPEFTELTL